MGKLRDFGQQARVKWGLFWRSSCRPWFTRRNLPYFVLLALVAFLVSSGLSRRSSAPPGVVPATPAGGGAREASTPLRLGQTPAEVGAAWDAMVASDAGDATSGADTVVDPAGFVQPCHGQIVRGRGWRRDRPGGVWSYHRGLDLKVRAGQPVLAIANGRVLRVAADEEGGTQVEVDHGQGWRSVYGQLGKVDVQAGQVVVRGQALGWPNGTAVHFELWQGQTVLDPLAVMAGLGSAVSL